MFGFLKIMDLLKIFRMQEPVSKELLSRNNDLAICKETIREKDELSKERETRIKELQDRVCELEKQNGELEIKLKNDNAEYQKIMQEYDGFISKITEDSNEIVKENETFRRKLRELEDLLQNHESTKEDMRSRLQKCETVINSITHKYNTLKAHSQTKLTEANSEVGKSAKEIEHYKYLIEKKQGQINELEKRLGLEKKRPDLRSEPPKSLKLSKSMLEPLKSL